MSKGKYSPSLTRKMIDSKSWEDYCYNARRERAPERQEGEDYNEEIHFENYDSDGYDSYGYSAYYADGKFAGAGNGVDRWGYTEMDYLTMSDDDFEDICIYGG